MGDTTGELTVAGVLTVVYGVIAYVASLASSIYAVMWLGNMGVPKTIDSGTAGDPLESAIVDVVLLGAFALQHSIMARPAFKRWWERYVPRQIERSTYVLATSVLLGVICLAWRPLPQPVWAVTGKGAVVLQALFWTGWLITVAATFIIDHFHFFGLRQSYLHAAGRPYSAPEFVERLFYRVVRHPIMLGLLIAFWATPVMSVGHLLFAIVTTLYILVGLKFEERDLLDEHGASYASYCERVPMIVPRIKVRRTRHLGRSA